MATKKAAKAKTTKKKAPAKKAAPVKAKKTTAKKAVAKKKTVTKAPAKKAAVKATPKKKPAAKTATKKKATPSTKKAAPAKKAPVKKVASKKTAAKKPTVKKKKVTAKVAKKNKATIAAVARPKIKPGNVGQAPRKTTVAASIPVPTQIPPREAPQADAKASKNAEASSDAKQEFKVNDQIVYPAHGVGKIAGLEKQQVAGIAIELFVIGFEQEKMKLRVPTGKARAAGMRPLSSDKAVKDAIALLKGRARIKRTMWSRRAQEYDAKINSGDIKLVAEVVRDLYRSAEQPEQSYSERQLFEAALDRLAREVAAVHKSDLGKAIEELDAALQKKAPV